MKLLHTLLSVVSKMKMFLKIFFKKSSENREDVQSLIFKFWSIEEIMDYSFYIYDAYLFIGSKIINQLKANILI